MPFRLSPSGLVETNNKKQFYIFEKIIEIALYLLNLSN